MGNFTIIFFQKRRLLFEAPTLKKYFFKDLNPATQIFRFQIHRRPAQKMDFYAIMHQQKRTR